MEDFRDALWGKARNLLLEGYEVEAYILILATWNFAGFRFILTEFDLKKFEKVIKTINLVLEKIGKVTFENADFTEQKLQENIKLIYNNLKQIVRQTGATKIMALKRPDLFIMWDTKIRKNYGINNKAMPNDYIEFLKKIKDDFGKIKWTDKKTPLAKAIDEYNYIKTIE